MWVSPAGASRGPIRPRSAEDVADRSSGALDPPADVARRRLDPVQPRHGAVELDGEAGAVVLHDLQLGLEIAAPALGLKPPRHRCLEQPKRRLEPPHPIVEGNRHVDPKPGEKPAKRMLLNTRRGERKAQSRRRPDRAGAHLTRDSALA